MLRKTGASKSSTAKTIPTITIRRRTMFLRIAMPTPLSFQEKAVPESQIVLPPEERNLSGKRTSQELSSTDAEPWVYAAKSRRVSQLQSNEATCLHGSNAQQRPFPRKHR